MYQPPIKGIVRKKALPRKVVDIKALEAEKILKKTSSLNKELEELKSGVIETLDSSLEQLVITVDQKMEEVDSILDSVLEKTNEIIESMSELEVAKGQGDDGEDGKDADEEKIKEEVLSELRKTLDRESIIQELLLRIPPAQVIDEKALLKKLLSKVPENKESLKIIRENIEVDPMAIIQKIMELPAGKFKIKSDQVDGLEQTMSAFRSQLGKGYLHGGGDTVAAGTNVTITTDSHGRKVINATGGVSETFESVLRNIKSYDCTVNYSSNKISTIVYTTGTGTITETVNYSGDVITSIVLSGDTPSGIDLTKSFNYTGTNITSFTYS